MSDRGFLPSAGGFAASRHADLVSRVRTRRRRRLWVVNAVGVAAWLAAFLLMRPWTWAEAAAAALLVVGGTAVALSAEMDVMPDWVENWKTGAEGEVATAGQLAVLPAAWAVRHDLAGIAGVKGNVDHVIAGPGGLFALETKKWPGHVVSTETGRLRRFRELTSDRPSDEMGAVGQAKHNARHVYEAVRAVTGDRVFVTPVLVLWADSVPAPERLNGVWVVPGPQLAMWLQQQPHVLPEPVLARAAAAVEGL